MRILLIEDERRLSSVVKKGLTEEGFAVDTAYDGPEGLFLAESESYDLIILDVLLPRLNGFEVCKQLRHKDVKTPILMLTARSALEDKIEGLDSGADDYLTKPFAFLELRSRIHALLRRGRSNAPITMKLADLELNPVKHKVIRAGKPINLTPKEFSILEFLLRHKDEVVTRTMITEHVWDYNFDSISNVVDVFIAALRRKIDTSMTVKLIHTIHGVGYKAGLST